MKGSVVVQAPNQLPTASFTATPTQPLPAEAVSFDGSASSDPGPSDPGTSDPGTSDPGTQEPASGGDSPPDGGVQEDPAPGTAPGDAPIGESDPLFAPDTTTPAVGGRALPGQRLRQVLRRGLRTRWSFTEPVDGVLRVLIKRPVARRLGLKGASRRVLVARATLSASKPGEVAVKVRFKKRLARKLRRARALDLRLDLRVADAAGNQKRLIRSARLRR